MVSFSRFLIFIFLICIGSSFGFSKPSHLAGKFKLSQLPTFTYNATATALVDRILTNVRNEVVARGLDRIKLPDISLSLFNQQTLSIKNQALVGLGNAYRVGDVIVNIPMTQFAFGLFNLSSEADVEIANIDNGHVRLDCDNVTAFQVFKLTHATQTLELDKFEITIGECHNTVSGLGSRGEKGAAILNDILSKLKDPILRFLNTTFKTVVNASLQATKAALLG